MLNLALLSIFCIQVLLSSDSEDAYEPSESYAGSENYSEGEFEDSLPEELAKNTNPE